MRQQNFFETKPNVVKSDKKRPLADIMRPKTLDEYMGQAKLVGETGPIKTMIQNDDIVSMVFWGPPGCGKTTLAKIIANETQSYFVQLSAVSAGKKDVEKVVNEARDIYQAYEGRRTILFLDEIHRFNKAQQDFLLPYVEDGTLILIGATTENPSFEVNSALLSRMRVFVFERLVQKDVEQIINRALEFIKQESSIDVNLNKKAFGLLVANANGDPRSALNILELAVKLAI